jgi:hypothetical protein
LAELNRLSAAGVALSEAPDAPVYLLRYGGAVPNDGSCLWSAAACAAGADCTPGELRHRVVKRVLADAGAGLLPRGTDRQLEGLYWPDLTRGWGVVYVKERRLVIRAVDAPAALQAIEELDACMERARAAELVYGERGTPVVRAACRAACLLIWLTRIRGCRRTCRAGRATWRATAPAAARTA